MGHAIELPLCLTFHNGSPCRNLCVKAFNMKMNEQMIATIIVYRKVIMINKVVTIAVSGVTADGKTTIINELLRSAKKQAEKPPAHDITFCNCYR